jgi:hypothetical protein
MSSDATEAGAQRIGSAAVSATLTATATTATVIAFATAAVSAAHGINTRAQRIRLPAGRCGAWTWIANALATQMGIGTWLALVALAARFAVFARATVLARTATGALIGIAWGIVAVAVAVRTVALASIATTTTAFAARALALTITLAFATWLRVTLSRLARALTAAAIASTG